MSTQDDMKRRAMDAVAHVKDVVNKAGWTTVMTGITAYFGHIREVDRERQAKPMKRDPHSIHRQSGLERLE